ncbi:DUF7269 family protein [Halomarina oriensis]|uniref:Uncharacterized protein n=1 Tax=Halomarina oriensis TaxID=671145 RepID=A0A6B0GTY5_9EURY|nr:hypothetical protein [Halomarina oriensis]MWG36073.1 hypothetical protein [Halomarina oriensis]
MSGFRTSLVAVAGATLLVAAVVLALDVVGWSLGAGASMLVVLSVVLAVTTAAMVGGIHWGEGVQQSAVESPESTVGTPRPGVELRALDGGRLPVGARRRAAIRDRLRRVAVRTLVAERGVSEAAAAERLTNGTWTTDHTAAALFTPTDGPLDRLRASVRFRRRARHAAVAIRRLAREAGEQ